MATDNMGLSYVVEGAESLVWSATIDSNTDLIDSHDHSSGSGAEIDSKYINVLSKITMDGPFINAGYLSFENKEESITGVLKLFVSGGDLYFLDGAGSVVQITSGNGLNNGTGSGSGGISGDYVEYGSASYSSSTETYTFSNLEDELSSIAVDQFYCTSLIVPNAAQSTITNLQIDVDKENMHFNFPIEAGPADYLARCVTILYDAETNKMPASLSSSATNYVFIRKAGPVDDTNSRYNLIPYNILNSGNYPGYPTYAPVGFKYQVAIYEPAFLRESYEGVPESHLDVYLSYRFLGQYPTDAQTVAPVDMVNYNISDFLTTNNKPITQFLALSSILASICPATTDGEITLVDSSASTADPSTVEFRGVPCMTYLKDSSPQTGKKINGFAFPTTDWSKQYIQYPYFYIDYRRGDII